MLHEVLEYARREGLVGPPGFKFKPVRWLLFFDRDGRYLETLELGDVDAKRNRGEMIRAPNLELGEMKRGGSGCRHFLVDTAQVVTLLGAEEDDAKARAKHEHFVGLLADASKVFAELAPVAKALADPEMVTAIRSDLESVQATPTENVTFALSGAEPERLVEHDTWHDWWQSFRSGLQPEGTGRRMRCLLSGELVEATPTHPKIKGLADVGGLSMGDVLPAFKQESFRSYGLQQAANAAMSEEMAAAYPAALNQLLRERSKKLAGNKVLHWYRETPEVDPVGWLNDPDLADPEQEQVDALRRARDLLEAIEAGKRPDLAGNRYYALTLSANSGRVVVRDWMTGSFEDLVRNVERWFDDLQIVTRDGQGSTRPPKMYAVLGSLVRDLDDLPDPLVAQMWRTAVQGGRFPQQAMARALARVRVAITTDDPVRTAGVGVLKACLRRQDPNLREELEPMLNPNHPSPAYQCGRLLATLDYVQYKALGDVGAGVVQRYYGAASTTPALVLGRLLRLAQFHLAKLDNKRERLGLERRIAEILDQLEDTIPATLTLEEQSLFALGYYQQKAHRPSAKTGDTETPDTETSEILEETDR